MRSKNDDKPETWEEFVCDVVAKSTENEDVDLSQPAQPTEWKPISQSPKFPLMAHSQLPERYQEGDVVEFRGGYFQVADEGEN